MSIKWLLNHSGAFIQVHPHSDLGDLNFAHRIGYDFVAFIPNEEHGLFVLRRASWLKRVCRSFLSIRQPVVTPIPKVDRPKRHRRWGTEFSDIGYGGKSHD